LARETEEHYVDNVDDIVGTLEARLELYLHELQLLAGIDSGSYDKPGVDRVQRWLGERLRSAGFQVERVPQERFGDDLIARRTGHGQGRVLLLGHADTVYPVGTAAERPMTVEGDRILGPGTCDMKAGLLAGIYAMDALLDGGWDDFGQVTFLVVSDEEIGDRHSVETLMREGAAHEAILTLEAARENGDIVTARKAVRWFTVEARGHAAHAGVEPHRGRNAIVALADYVVRANALNGLRDGVTINAGVIEGGTTPNVVAERARVRFDVRAWTDDDLDAATDALRRLSASSSIPDVQLTVTLESGSECPAMERTPGVEALERKATEIAGQLGFPLRGAATGGASDISYAAHAGTPGLDGLGPIGGLDHSPDEYILRSSIVPRTALLAGLIKAIGERQV
jgi:glutamate carboxypeptidase